MTRMDDPRKSGRRDFLKLGVATGLSAAIPGAVLTADADRPPAPFAAPPMERVRIGFVGVGGMGTVHVRNLLQIDGAEIRAVCDIVEDKVARAQELVQKAGQPRPSGYARGPRDFERMCGEEDLDLVYTATPWEWHVPVCIAAMKAGKHAATEVPAAYTLDDCWLLVETAETTRKHCVLMENCCYDRREMMILNLVRRGMLGELLHAECGYLHDLRGEKLSDYYVGRWRLQHSIRRNGDLYPTHGVGPVAQWMNINRGNQFDYAVSMASNSRGLNLWAAEHFGPNSAEAVQPYALGDVVTTMVKTKAGQTIVITHNTDSPRPYSRNILLQGTKGLMRKYPNSLIS